MIEVGKKTLEFLAEDENGLPSDLVGFWQKCRVKPHFATYRIREGKPVNDVIVIIGKHDEWDLFYDSVEEEYGFGKIKDGELTEYGTLGEKLQHLLYNWNK